jgi:hypothetical protein
VRAPVEKKKQRSRSTRQFWNFVEILDVLSVGIISDGFGNDGIFLVRSRHHYECQEEEESNKAQSNTATHYY